MVQPEAKKVKRVRKFAVGLGGGFVILIGIIAIPYPGPGWLIVFAGLFILSSEFAWAGRLLTWLRQRYDRFQTWILLQGRLVQLLLFLSTTIVVVTTLWLINAYGLLVGLLGLDWPWARSPFVW